MTKIHCRAVLFDMDGVLVDSTPAVARVWAAWARHHGFEDIDAIVKMAHGRQSIATIRELLPHGDHEAENLDVERREIEDVSDVIALPGAVELLRALPVDRWAVVTSATRPLAEVRLRAAGLPMPQFLITANDTARGKPHPDPYLQGATSLGVPAQNCVVAEDAPAGIRAGKAAAAQVLALRTTTADAELIDAGADWIADNLSSLQLVLNSGGEFILAVK